MKYKLFGSSGLRVSEICLGTMTFGMEWNFGVDYETSKAIFEIFTKAGGNFIDTANLYNLGTSEKWTGEFIKADRHHFVLATKYSLYDRWGDVSFSGNNRKNMFRSVEDSLKRLNTEFIDLLWLHAWDFTTPVEEVMRGLDDLVRTGKVHYIGISNVPAWIVSQANTLAHFRGWTSFNGLQIEYSLIERNAERELMPMAKSFNIAVTPWAPLGGGVLTGKYLKKNEGRINDPQHRRRSSRNEEIVREVVTVAKELGVTPGQVAINWTKQRNQVVIPIVGATRVSQIEDSLKSTEFVIPELMMKRLDEVSKITMGYPHDFLNSDMQKGSSFGGTYDQIEFDKS
jgi:aryl-alcohol dehydrogenase-like predicted oxidoreductase